MSFPFPLAPDLVAGKFSHSGPLDGPVPLPLLVDDSGPSYPCDTAEAKVGAMATWRAKRGVRAREGARSQAHQGSQGRAARAARRKSRRPPNEHPVLMTARYPGTMSGGGVNPVPTQPCCRRHHMSCALRTQYSVNVRAVACGPRALGLVLLGLGKPIPDI